MSIFKNKGLSEKEKVIFDLKQLIEAIESDEIELAENVMDISAPYAYDINLVRSKEESIYGVIYKYKKKNEKIKCKTEQLKSIYDDEKRTINNNIVLPLKKEDKNVCHSKFPILSEDITNVLPKKRGRPRLK